VLPTFLALQAEAYARTGRIDAALQFIEQALAAADETGECWAIAEVLRIKADLLLATGGAAAGEARPLCSTAWRSPDVNRRVVGSCVRRTISRAYGEAEVVASKHCGCCTQSTSNSQKASTRQICRMPRPSSEA
jgi:hypothetical protein